MNLLSPLPAERPVLNWLRAWAAFAAFYFPALWLANSMVWAGPSLARVALFGYRLRYFRLTALGAFASSLPGEQLNNVRPFAPPPDISSLPTLILLIAVVVGLAAVAGRNVRWLAGFGVAILGNAALLTRLFQFVASRGVDNLAAAALFFAVQCLGLRWMLAGWSVVGYAKRAASLFAGFVLLPLLFWYWSTPFWRSTTWKLSLLRTVPGALAALLVSFREVPSAPLRPRLKGWMPLALGLASTALVFFSVRAGAKVIERGRLEANRAAMTAYPKIPADLPYTKLFFQKGVNLAAGGPGGYASEDAREVVKLLPTYAVNAVALVPYGFASRSSTQIFFPGGLETDEGLEEMSRVAHAVGLRVMMKPGIWVGGGGFAGDLQFSSGSDRAKWFAEYQRFVEHYARLAKEIHADVFSVGGEFIKLSSDEAAWRKLIARARALYPGPLTYAANFGEEFENVKFWDALDYIGLQEYYPLPDNLSTDGVVQKVEAVAQRFERPVIFTEVGFPSLVGANRNPWDDSRRRPLSPELQARCYEAVFQAFYNKHWFQGMYWWKVETSGYGGPKDGSHIPWGKPAMDVLSSWYRRGRR